VDPTVDDEREEPDDEGRDEQDTAGPNGEYDDGYDGPYDDYEAPLDLGAGDVVATATRKYGRGGGALAAGMFAVDVLISGEKKKPESVQVQEASSQPIDVDTEGIQVSIDDVTSVEAPPLERRPPLSLNKKRSRRR
jgi:hypothetical protein